MALGAYPWNDAGIVHRSAGEPISPEDYKHGYRDPYVYRPWKMEGYMLGVDPYGRPIFKVNGKQIGGGVLGAKDTSRQAGRAADLPMDAPCGHLWRGPDVSVRQWAAGRIRRRRPGPIAVPDRDVLIGLNGDAQRVSDPVSHSRFAANNNMPLVYGIEGLIDEVMIYDRALTAEEIRRSFQEFCPPAGATDPARPRTTRPAGRGGRLAGGEVRRHPARR